MQIIAMTPEELKEVISEAIKTELKNYRLTDTIPFLRNKRNILPSMKLRLLKISRPTLFKRMLDNTILYCRVGRRLLFSIRGIRNIIESKTIK